MVLFRFDVDDVSQVLERIDFNAFPLEGEGWDGGVELKIYAGVLPPPTKGEGVPQSFHHYQHVI
jgi:hypothetical protein